MPHPTALAPEPEAGGAPQPIDWSSADDCLGRLRLLSKAASTGRLAADEPLPVAVMFRSGRRSADDWAIAPARPIKADLPLAVHEEEDPQLEAAACVLEIGPVRDLRAQRQPLGQETVRSMYVSGTRSKRNPDYEAVQARVREAERDLKQGGPQVLAVGDPLLDLVGLLAEGVLGAFEFGSDRAELEEALSELSATPRSHERPILHPYHFERSVVRARRSALVPIALIDREAGRTWRAEIRQRELREFHILDGLDARDRDYAEHRRQSISPLELDRWQETPPEVPLSTAIAALLDGPADTGPVRASLASIDSASIAPAAGPPSPRPTDAEDEVGPRSQVAAVNGVVPGMQSVVGIEHDGRAGSGFYVHPHFVLTTLGLVEDASLIDVTTVEGDAVPGLLAHADPGRGLALVHVPRPGTALKLSAERPAEGSRIEILAHDDARARIAPARLDANGSILELRLPSPIRHGEGGAVLLDGRVAGIVTEADTGDESASVLPGGPILDFLDRAADEIPALR